MGLLLNLIVTLDLPWLSTMFMTLSFVVKIFSLLTTKSTGKRKFYESFNFCDFSANVLKFYDIFQVFSCMTF